MNNEKKAGENPLLSAAQNLQSCFENISPERLRRLSGGLARAAVMEDSRRTGFLMQFKMRVGHSLHEEFDFETTTNPIESGIIEFHQKIIEAKEAEEAKRTPVLSHGKGLSLDLAYVDQLADWKSGHVLDEQFRLLPDSEALKDAGFVFNSVFPDDEAQINYSFFVDGSIILAERKRAIADVVHHDGTDLHIIKKTMLLFDPAYADEGNIRRIIEFANIPRKNKNPELKKERSELGMKIVEPYIQKPRKRAQPSVVPVSSHYFALHRIE